MKASVALYLSISFLFFSCNNSDREPKASKSENDIDAARDFLDAALKGDYKTASHFMLQDSGNIGYLAVTERSYRKLDPGKRDSLKSASLRFYDTRQVNDSTTVTIFSNSYKNDRDTLRIVKKGGQWLVDLKYLFEHDLDTMFVRQKPGIDTVHK